MAAALTVPSYALADSGGTSPGCRLLNVEVPASVLSDQVVDAPAESSDKLTINGRLCVPRGRAPQTVMLALHGITYTSEYWDMQFEPDTYSFARSMIGAGYAIFATDRLGYGRSSHPPAQLVTLDSQAAVAHELIGKLRAGQVGGTPFKRVILVGHSYGTATSWLETSQYNDADAVIGTGWANTIQSEPLGRFFTGFYPAQVDPKFAGAGLPPGYLTPMPGTRNQNFLYDLSNADPRVIEYDQNVLRDTVTDGEGSTFYNRYGDIPLGYEPGSSDELLLSLSQHVKNITVPAFLVNGTGELFFCGTDQKHCNNSQELQRSEAEYFSPKACFRAAVTPNAGHDLNLQYNAAFTYKAVRTWADQVLGPNGTKYDAYVANCERFSGTNIPPGRGTFGAFGGP